jgi:hypothetical protein
MSIRVNVKRTIKINGKEYGSLDEVPEGLRDAVSRALAGSAPGGPSDASGVRTRVVFNSVEYPSIDAMPQEVRQLYESVVKVSDVGAPSVPSAATRSSHAPPATEFESSFSSRAMVVSVLVVGLLLLLYHLWQAR